MSSTGFPKSRSSHNTTCTRTHQMGALVLIATTFFITRLVHQSFPPNNLHPLPSSLRISAVSFDPNLPFSWPDLGYGSRLSVKIYVYGEDEIDGLKDLLYGRDHTISADACVKGQWGTQLTVDKSNSSHIMVDYGDEFLGIRGRGDWRKACNLEVKIHNMLLKSKFRTLNKEEADLFFVPAYAKCVRMMGGLNDKEINQTYVKVLNQMPYFRLSGGRNHIFVFPSGAGAHLFKSWAPYLNRSIILTPEGDRTDKRGTSAFNTWKDIIIPGNVDDGMTKEGATVVQPLPLSRRKYLANFLGRAQGKVGRLQLIDLARKFPNKLESPELKFSGPNKLGRKEYFEHLRNAKFCLAPRGESSWTLRFYESFFVECVPVILSDQAELPFQNVIDYTQISIKWPSTRIGTQLLQYLESISDEEIEKMIDHGRRIRCLYAYAPESQPCSAFTAILWELQRKIRHFQQSAETFWLHNTTVVNRDLLPFSNWKPPMQLP